MPINQDVRAYLDAAGSTVSFPDAALSDPRAAADYLARARAPKPARVPEPVNRVEDRTIDGDVKLRSYFPAGSGPHPVVLFFHGGGWVMGGLDSHDSFCRRLCNVGECIVVSVDYRLAPEHRYPAAVDDAERAGVWLREHVEELGGDPERLVVAGSSAGGNVAAALTLRDRAAGRSPFDLQLLLYPVTDCGLDTASHRDNARGYLLEHNQMRWFWEQYVPDAGRRLDPYASPLRAESLTGLPAAVVMTAEFDPLRDEGDAYARRLQDDGVDVIHLPYEGQVHGFLGMLGIVPEADQAVERIGEIITSRRAVA